MVGYTRTRTARAALLALFCLGVSACSAGAAPGLSPSVPRTAIVVSVAASLTDAMQAAQQQFATAHPEIELQFNFGSSGALQQQIEQGAPVDLFISAGSTQMDSLVRKGLVAATAVRPLASNRVVLITSKAFPGDIKSWDDLRGATRIAIGDPAHVPAGQYGREVLEHLGLWEAVQPKLVLDQDVRAVLHHVETGDAQAGIVYSTDAATSQQVSVVAAAPAGSHQPVLYPMAVVKGSRHPDQAQALDAYLRSDQGQAILARFGFGQGA